MKCGKCRSVSILLLNGQAKSLIQTSLFSFSVKNLNQDRCDQLAAILRVQHAIDPGNYLGLPLSVPHSKTHACKQVQEKLNIRLVGWKARSLSQAGCAVLIQSVASSIPSYIMSVSKLSKRVSRAIDIRLKKKFWGFDDVSRRFHPKSWESICKPKSCGGLGLRKMEDLNRALVAKLG